MKGRRDGLICCVGNVLVPTSAAGEEITEDAPDGIASEYIDIRNVTPGADSFFACYDYSNLHLRYIQRRKKSTASREHTWYCQLQLQCAIFSARVVTISRIYNRSTKTQL